ncbi:MAG: hypothetical protein OWV35_04515 [Firmicutes bacterium]|nr:hypothetical protein [Bacillota bacterium]
MSVATLRFQAVDSWFFRNARPYDVLGGMDLEGRFPPPARTLAGAVRTLLGDAWGVDWEAFARHPDTYRIAGQRLRDRIGWGPDPGPLRFSGPWLIREGQRLYPAPRFLFWSGGLPEAAGDAPAGGRWWRARIGPPVRSDRGLVRLPVLPPDAAGAAPVEGVWLTAAGMERVLAGGLPQRGEWYPESQLWAYERHFGIARFRDRRTVQPGLLYHATHVRPDSRVALELEVRGGPERWPLPAWVRLGGDGRAAMVEAVDRAAWPRLPACRQGGLVLMLATPGTWDGDLGVLPGFVPAERAGVRSWVGSLLGIRLRLHAAVMDPPVREGGWDLARGRPVARRAYVPAGSSWYVTVEGGSGLEEAVSRLHGGMIGEETEYGRGHLLAGCWPLEEGCPQG